LKAIYLFIFTGLALLLAIGTPAAMQNSQKKVRVTLVRWPYT